MRLSDVQDVLSKAYSKNIKDPIGILIGYESYRTVFGKAEVTELNGLQIIVDPKIACRVDILMSNQATLSHIEADQYLQARKVVPLPSYQGYAHIKAGSFIMGSPEGEGFEDEHPQHLVTLTNDFYLKATPVTQEEWERVMGNNPSHFKGASLPVESISWFDAIEYCNRLSLLEGLKPAYLYYFTPNPDDKNVTWDRSKNGYRLPIEAEWEYACRAGTITSSYGELNEIAWYYDNSQKTSQPVGERKPNNWGLYDMLGNVWEWVWDWYGAYPSSAVTNPIGPTTSTNRVLRGGSWNYSAYNCRAALRINDDPSNRFVDVGFRPCRTIFQSDSLPSYICQTI